MNDGTTHSAPAAPLEHLEEIEQDCVRRFVSLLADRLAENLVEVRLFGSAARGDMWRWLPISSDVDLLVLTQDPVNATMQDELVNATYPLYLECGRQIGPQWRTLDQWQNPQTDPEREFKRNVEAEGRELFKAGGSVPPVARVPELRSAKLVIRCRDFSESRKFYSLVLGLPCLAEWEEQGGRGAIFALGEEPPRSFIEIYEMETDSERYDASFSQPLQNDKIDLQLRTDDLQGWADALRGVWAFVGPERLPWGQRWIKVRDPDALQIAIYEGED